MPALTDLTIAEAGRRIARGVLSPVDLVSAQLERIEAVDGRLHSFIRLLAKDALREARRAERTIRAGGYLGPLHGIPVGLKDVIETKGVATTAQSKIHEQHVPAADATVVRRLRAAGAIILGKLTTHEFAIGGPSFDLPWPPARNPWNLDRFTGGSSSGSGAAVAAGLVSGALGTDTGGSIRTPAAFCGIAGLKPSYGLVSRAGVIPLAFSLDHCGPMAWTAEDCALMLDAMAGFDPADPASVSVRPQRYARHAKTDIAGMRIGVVRHFYERDLEASAEVHRGIEAALKVLRGLGAKLVTVELPRLAEWDTCALVLTHAEGYAVHESNFKSRPGSYGKVARERLLAGAMLRASDYIQAQRQRRRLSVRYAEAMANLDGLITASVLDEPSRIDEMVPWSSLKPRQRMASTPFNVTGAPALVVCVGLSSNGLPLAMQIAAKPFDDGIALAIGRAYERATNWRSLRPPL
ncbi:MAG: amidase [Proteobacteria bacterium]|nr:amidase [Pseudomonadota bacterium]MBI3497276.1 amidase [Pseudomonadota bacterium]